jgi:hypothetical protein
MCRYVRIFLHPRELLGVGKPDLEEAGRYTKKLTTNTNHPPPTAEAGTTQLNYSVATSPASKIRELEHHRLIE